MKKRFPPILIFSIYFAFAAAQSSVQVRYFSNESLTKEVLKEKGKFSKSTINNDDESVTTEVTNIKNSEIIHSETWKDKEPYGIWKNETGRGIEEMDYNFPLVYSTADCPDSLNNYNVNDPFKSDNNAHYKAPQLSTGDSTIFPFLSKNIRYPARARENNIQGRVVLSFIITKSGAIENISVLRGEDVSLDKEAVRVMRKLKFSIPPMIDGKPQNICVRFPVTFKLA